MEEYIRDYITHFLNRLQILNLSFKPLALVLKVCNTWQALNSTFNKKKYFTAFNQGNDNQNFPNYPLKLNSSSLETSLMCQPVLAIKMDTNFKLQNWVESKIYFHIKIPSTLLRALFANLNFWLRSLLFFTIYSFMKNSRPCLKLSSSGVTAARVKIFHTKFSGYSKMASNRMRKCMILFGVNRVISFRSTVFRTERDRVKEATISATNFARCIDLISGIDSRSLNWSHRQNCK